MPRIILHIDMNSYFASVEQQANPFLRGKPIGIVGKNQKRSIVATASIEAKKLGVKTAMSTWEAKKICPSLLFIPGDPEKYSFITNTFNKLFLEFTDQVEQFSVDESFLDITEQAKDYFGAVWIAQSLRQRLKEECGEWITASIGVAPNKLLAKLASESVKPNGLTVVEQRDAIQLLDTQELNDVCGIGRSMVKRLHNLGINTFKQLREFPLTELIDEFDSYGYWLHHAAHGRGDDELQTEAEDPKSVGHSYTLPFDTLDSAEIKRYLLGLAEKVAWRLRRDEFAAQTLSVYVRYDDFSSAGKQCAFKEASSSGLDLFHAAWNLIDKFRDPTKPIRLIGISTSNLSQRKNQISIYKKEQKMHSVLSALDTLQHRYGSSIWTRASLIPIEFKERSSGFRYDHEL